MTWLTEIEGRLARATPGPWQAISLDRSAAAWWIPEAQSLSDGECAAMPTENAILIAHAPEDIGRLLAVARAAEAVVQRGCPTRPADGSCAHCQWWTDDGSPAHGQRCPWFALVAALDGNAALVGVEDAP